MTRHIKATILTIFVVASAAGGRTAAEQPETISRGESGIVATPADDLLPPVYMPYRPGHPIPSGWQLQLIKIPVTETCTKTVCEDEVIRVPRVVHYMETQKIRVPTEVYKTYVKFRDVQVEDGVSVPRPANADDYEPGDLRLNDDLRRRGARHSDGDREVPVSTVATELSNLHPHSPKPHDDERYERVPVIKTRKKRVTIQVEVKKIVDVDEGCWKETVVLVPAPCGPKPHCPLPADDAGIGVSPDEVPPGMNAIVRRTWEPRIVQREITVLESREIEIDEPYTEYIPRPLPDVAPDAAPDVAPDLGPISETEYRTEQVPQYFTKAERHYITKTIQVPSTRTVYDTVTRQVTREVPYEVSRLVTKYILVPCGPGAIPAELKTAPLRSELSAPKCEILSPPKGELLPSGASHHDA